MWLPHTVTPGDAIPETVTLGEATPGTVTPGEVISESVAPGEATPGTVTPGTVTLGEGEAGEGAEEAGEGVSGGGEGLVSEGGEATPSIGAVDLVEGIDPTAVVTSLMKEVYDGTRPPTRSVPTGFRCHLIATNPHLCASIVT
jgi:hypothetical protein